MLVADYIMSRVSEYTDYIFNVYGSASASLIDALFRVKGLELICCQHEQHATFMAEGYFKTTGKIGAVVVTSGPGASNTITGIMNAYYDSFPMLVLTGNVSSKFMRPHTGVRSIGFQEAPVVDIVQPITKYAVQIKDPKDIKYELEKALYIAFECRPGPVLLDLPLDIQKMEINPDELVGYTKPYTKPFSYEEVNWVARSLWDDIRNAKRPVFLIGGGVKRKDFPAFKRLNDLLKIPVIPTYNSLDVICDDYEYHCGGVGTFSSKGHNFCIQNCDLLISIGCRTSGRITGGLVESFARDAKKYLIDIDENNLDPKYQQVKYNFNCKSTAQNFIEALTSEIGLTTNPDMEGMLGYLLEIPNFSEWTNRCLEWKKKYDPVKPEHFSPSDIVHPYAFLRILSQEMTKDDILAVCCGGNLVATNHAFETKTGQIYITNNGNSPLGGGAVYGLGAYLGIKDINPKSKVIAISGDGGLMLNLSILQTIVDYGIKIKLIALNNAVYGITKAFQVSNFESRFLACGGQPTNDYKPCDFIKVGQAFGLKTRNIAGPVKDYEDVRKQIREFLDNDDAELINIDCKNYYEYLPAIRNWQCPIEDQIPYLPRKEFNEQMIIEPTEFSKNIL